jgi:hypothetical protein
MSEFTPHPFGWHPDLPDFRDLDSQSEQVAAMLADLPAPPTEVPSDVDLREFFPGVSTDVRFPVARACVTLVDYFSGRSTGRRLEPSARFLNHVACRLSEPRGLCGIDLRSHLKAMVTCGVPPAWLWPDHGDCQNGPLDPLLYSFQPDYRDIRYVRLDGRNRTGRESLRIVKSFLAAGFPSAFGVSMPSSWSDDDQIPFRPQFDGVRGGQVLVAVGYDDHRPGGKRGALLIRGPWGRTWGDEGYGWLPYAFVEQQLACCFWTLFHRDWLASGEFQRPDVFDPPSQ